MARQAGAVVGMLFLAHAAAAQFTQQGSKLVGTGAVWPPQLGTSVAISGDGSTAIVGGPRDDSVGAAWVFARSGGVWSQQGSKLVGTGAVGVASQGQSVAISADGNTAIVGGPDDNNGGYVGIGAAWVYTRNGGVWSQQGSKLVGTDAAGAAQQGWSVAISADGTTAIVGGPYDNSYAGAARVFTRSGGAWPQQGSKLVGAGAVATGGVGVGQGASVAVSADGNTAIVGGGGDNSGAGAAWVFTRSGGAWSQQGSKLVGSGAAGASQQGRSVGISADGETAVVGGLEDNSLAGAAWVFARSGGVWSQQGNKLVGTGAVGTGYQGASVAISADGNSVIVGGWHDNTLAGAAWVFTRSGGVWSQQGSKLVGTGAVGQAYQGGSVALSADGSTAIVGGFYDSSWAGAAWVYTRSGGVWTQQGSKLVGTGSVSAGVQRGYSVAISADGNTAIVGGPGDKFSAGATWVFTRSGGVWTQQGSKLVGTGAVGTAGQGTSVAISGDGNTAIVGGYTDDTNAGAAWVFAAPTCAWSVVPVANFTSSPASPVAGQAVTFTDQSSNGPTAWMWDYGDGTNTGAQPLSTPSVAHTYSAAGTFTVSLIAANCKGSNADLALGGLGIFQKQITVSQPCTGATISAQPQSQSIQSGQTATLLVTATGTAPLSYQWYQGISGDTSSPVGANSNSFTTPALTSTRSYWVRVANSCGTANSGTVTVTVSQLAIRRIRRLIPAGPPR
jgi:hypothetical protein